MKKKMAAIVCAALCFGAVCGSTVLAEELETAMTENMEEKESETEEKLEEIELDKPYVVETPEGTYNFTIQELRRTDWLDDAEKEVWVLKYVVKNEDYEPENGSILLLGANSFHMETGDGEELEAWDSTMSEFGFPDFVEPGEEKEQEQPYVILKDMKKVKLIFVNAGEEEAEILLDLEIEDGEIESSSMADGETESSETE